MQLQQDIRFLTTRLSRPEGVTAAMLSWRDVLAFNFICYVFSLFFGELIALKIQEAKVGLFI